MLLNRLVLLLPTRRGLVTVLISGVAGAALAIAVSGFLELPSRPAPNPAPPHDPRFVVEQPIPPAPNPAPPYDPRFVVLGRDYLPQLGKAYAAAWDEGAKELEAGQPVATALATVSKTWSAGRAELYNHVFTPEFSRIIPESGQDSDVTPEKRAALAAAWRGLSLGLSQ